MNQKSIKPTYLKMIADYEERLRSLRSDGYRIRFYTSSREFCFASLKHMTNGKTVTLYLDLHARTLRQLTNKVLTHCQEYPKSV